MSRKNGKEEIKYDIPCMEKYLKDTYGITVYQEQVMLLSRQLADFTRGQSDALRKAMGKKKKAIVDQMKPMFIEGGKKNGHDPKVLEKIWADWEKFASYAFNKSHATCYSWVAYQTAYLKAHYPAEYMAANMSRNLANITEITKLMDECKSMGIETLGPDVNESWNKFSVNKDGAIRFGLAAIKGMGTGAAEALISEREKNGPYKDIFDVAQRVNLSACNRKCFESMALSGGFDSFGIKRERYFGKNEKGENFFDTMLRFGQCYQVAQNESANSLFGGFEAVEIATPKIPEGEQWSDIERLNKERELVGIYLSAHPLDEFAVVLNNMCNTRCPEISDKEELAKRGEVTVGGIVTGVRESFTKKSQKPCGFIMIEDFSGSGELALFGEMWGKWRGMFSLGCSVYITANVVQKGANYYDFNIADIQYLQTVKDKRIEKLTIDIDAQKITEVQVSDLMELVKENPGSTNLFVQLKSQEHRRNVTMRSGLSGVDVNRNLLMYIDSCDAMDYFIN